MERVFFAIGAAAINIFDPRGGNGPRETFIGVLLVGAFIGTIFFKHDEGLEPILTTLVTTVFAGWFGYKIGAYQTPPPSSP